ncbi:MAG: cation diffusion facilitator family transporter [Candidatus Aenigmarchaeota archaeon]|nr:cation diffusion facilitator family transporter [Candidatus Aenigmarchaeota archaeon]
MSLRRGQKAAGHAVMISFLLVVAKGTIGFLSGSIALISDALQTLTDLIIDGISWIGLKVSQKKADEKFNYGYYKAESLATAVVSVIIISAAIMLMFEGYSRLHVAPEINIPFIALLVSFVSSFISFFLSRYLSEVGTSINSQVLIVNSKDRLMDSISSIFVFIAILLSYYKIPYVDGIAAIIISLLVLKIGLCAIKDSIVALMDASPSKEKEEQIKGIINSIEEVDNFMDLKLRKSGPFIFGDIKIKVKKSLSFEKAHEIADEVEYKLREGIKQIDSFVVHVEPNMDDLHKIAIPIKKPTGLDMNIMNRFGKSDFFLFVETEKNSVTKFYLKENRGGNKTNPGLSAVYYILKEGADTLITKQIGETTFNVLKDESIIIYKSKGKTAKEVVNNFLKGRLIKLKKPTVTKGEKGFC